MHLVSMGYWGALRYFWGKGQMSLHGINAGRLRFTRRQGWGRRELLGYYRKTVLVLTFGR